jgi:hypothetical protein
VTLTVASAAPAKQISLHHYQFPRRTPDRDLHMAFKILYVYDYITKLCRQQAEVIQNHDNQNVPNIGQGEPRLGGGQAYDRSSDYTAVLANTTRNRA